MAERRQWFFTEEEADWLVSCAANCPALPKMELCAWLREKMSEFASRFSREINRRTFRRIVVERSVYPRVRRFHRFEGREARFVQKYAFMHRTHYELAHLWYKEFGYEIDSDTLLFALQREREKQVENGREVRPHRANPASKKKWTPTIAPHVKSAYELAYEAAMKRLVENRERLAELRRKRLALARG